MQANNDLYPIPLDKNTIKQTLSELIRPLVPKTAIFIIIVFVIYYQSLIYLGFRCDTQSFQGKVVLITDTFILVQQAGTKNHFIIINKAYINNLPELGNQIEVKPYARKHFNSKSIDEPEQETITLDDGIQYVTTKMMLGGNITELPLPIPKEQIQCPELLELIEQLENLPSLDSFRCISHLLVNAGAKDFTLNDPKVTYITNSPPSIRFTVENAKFTGKVTIAYDRGADTCIIQTTPSVQPKPISTKSITITEIEVEETLEPTVSTSYTTEPMKITNVYFDDLAIRLG